MLPSKLMNIPFSHRKLISRSQSCAIQPLIVKAPQSNNPLGSLSLQLCQLTAEPSLHDQRSRHAAHSSSVTSPQSHGQPHEQPHTSWARRIPNQIFGSLQYIIHNIIHFVHVITWRKMEDGNVQFFINQVRCQHVCYWKSMTSFASHQFWCDDSIKIR